MIRVNDPSLVTISLSVRDAGNLKAIHDGLVAGVEVSPELQQFWDEFLAQYEIAKKRQLWIYRSQNPDEPMDPPSQG